MSSEAVTDEHTAERRPHAEGGEHGAHPTDAFYIKIALILAVVTALEVWVSYAEDTLKNAANPTLLIMALIKFFMVAMYFMHLKFDNRTLRYLFVGGLVLAAGCYIAMLLMFHALA